MPAIVTFGSINMDLIAHAPKLPEPGETIAGHQFAMIPGGKGANQAVAVARLGMPSMMVGRVGDDRFGQALVAELQGVGVECDHIWVDSTTTSGIAMIVVDDRSENSIVLIPGANGDITDTDVDRLKAPLSCAAVLLLQLEIPLPAVIAAAEAAQQVGVTVILDPAPAPPVFPADLYPLIDIITPNQIEATQLTGISVQDFHSAAQAASVLHERGARTVIIKLGRQGAYCSTGSEQFMVPAFSVQAIDTVAAGDAFNGGLAAALAAGLSLQQAISNGLRQ